VINNSYGAEIVVSDDGSIDGSVEYLKKNFPNVVVVAGEKQRGFAGNVDAGVAAASGDVVVLLNTDVEPENGWLVPLLNHFTDQTIFGVGCLEKSHEKTGVVLRGRGLSKWEKGFFVHSKGEVNARATAWVSGGSAAFRRSVWNTLGGMNTIFNPFYWEDIDLSYMAMKAGYRVMFEKESVVHHWHEEGKIKTSFTPDQVKVIVFRNQFIFHWKNISDKKILLAHLFWLPIRLIQALFRLDFIMIRGYFMALGKMPQILSERKRLKPLWKRDDRDLIVLA
jgi:GT2 family glycosyltransferase